MTAERAVSASAPGLATASIRVIHVLEPVDGGVPFFVGALQHEPPPNMTLITIAGSRLARFGRLGRALTLVFRVRRAIRENRPDLVHLHSSFASFSWLACGSVPFVYTSHAWPSWVDGPVGVVWRVLASVARLGHAGYLALSLEELDEAIRIGYPADRVHYIGSFVPPLELGGGSRSAELRAGNLLFVGRRSKQKGWEYLQPIVETLPPALSLRTVGVGASGENIVDLESVEVSFDDLVGQSAALVQPSRYEGVSLVALKAAALGVPIVAFATPGSEWITRYRVGTVVPAGDTVAFAAAAAEYANGDKVIDPCATHDFRLHFSRPEFDARLREAYLRVLASR